jgi:Leucine-rich repeat (LRR) protein
MDCHFQILPAHSLTFHTAASNNLVGTVPDEMKFLSRIEILTLPYNPDLTGSLPDGLGRMGQLSHLSLQWCGLQGTFPTWLSDVEKLQYLMLGNNHLTGSIPDEIWRLGNLKVLGLDNNMLSAKLDVFGSLPNLKSLYVEGNLISGSLTSELMAGWDAMEELDLGENFLGGMLPEQFFLQPNDALKILDLHGNQFQGSLPNAIDQDHFQNLEYLALAKNKFTGIVPEHIGRLTGLKHLDLSLNYFTWIQPDSLGQLTSLEYLFTGGNQFDNSPIPGFLIYLTNLRDLSMRSNNLTGSIPLILVQLSKLELLDLRKFVYTWTAET